MAPQNEARPSSQSAGAHDRDDQGKDGSKSFQYGLAQFADDHAAVEGINRQQVQERPKIIDFFHDRLGDPRKSPKIPIAERGEVEHARGPPSDAEEGKAESRTRRVKQNSLPPAHGAIVTDGAPAERIKHD